jgi:hypothetical protein
MVYIPSKTMFAELVSSKQLVRLDMALTAGRRQPAIIIKSSSLNLKYLIAKRTVSFVIYQNGDAPATIYAVRIGNNSTLWSVCASPNEVAALNAVVAGDECAAYLFNEATANVASTIIAFAPIHGAPLAAFVAATPDEEKGYLDSEPFDLREIFGDGSIRESTAAFQPSQESPRPPECVKA